MKNIEIENLKERVSLITQSSLSMIDKIDNLMKIIEILLEDASPGKKQRVIDILNNK